MRNPAIPRKEVKQPEGDLGSFPNPHQDIPVPSPPPTDEEAKQILAAAETKAASLFASREGIPEVSQQFSFFSPTKTFRETGDVTAYEMQVKEIRNGRIGDAMFPVYNGQGNAMTQQHGICLCGEAHVIAKQTLRRMAMHEQNLEVYFLKLEPETTQPYVCRHIEKELRKVFPVHTRAWEDMKGGLAAVQREAEGDEPLESLAYFDKECLRKDVGLLNFIKAIGPERRGRTLRRVGKRLDFRPSAYEWKYEARKALTGERKVLSGRFDAIMQRSRRDGIAVGWKSREEFIKDALDKLPVGAKVEDMRLRFDDAANNGFNARTMRWASKGLRKRKSKEADKFERGLMIGMEVQQRLYEGMALEEAFAEAEEVVN